MLIDPPPPLALLREVPRHRFSTGRGGVGKTSLACACALALADAGRRVLIVGTDPASNLDERLGVALSGLSAPGRGASFSLRRAARTGWSPRGPAPRCRRH